MVTGILRASGADIGACVVLAVAACAALPALAGPGDTPARPARPLTLRLALDAATAAQASCAARGYQVGVSVVDRAGDTLVILAGDGANRIKTEASRRKAYTAAVFGQSSADLAAAMPGFNQDLRPLDPNLLALPGAVPIRDNGVVVGAIGVAGAAGGGEDEKCAREGAGKAAAPPAP